jgi:hypothetical protein
MKNFLYLAIAISSFAIAACGPTHVVVESPAPPPPPPPAPELTYQTFYDALSPYGTWIDYPQYGYVWMPNVGPDFRPYGTNGHWVYTDQGWMWASDYSWGWAVFHYGRWFYQDGYGWMWIPGYDWAPAWVSWRRSPEYYGWAPLEPAVTIDVVSGGGYNPPPHYWCFVPQQYVARPQVNTYFVSEQQNVTIVQNTTIIRNTTIVNNTVNNTTVINNNVNNSRVTVNNYTGGPDPNEVSRVSGMTIRPVALQESNKPGQQATGGGLAVYRPRFNPPAQSGATGTRPAMTPPPHVQTLNAVHPVNTTVYGNRGANNTNAGNTTNTTNTTSVNNQPVRQVTGNPANGPATVTPTANNGQPTGTYHPPVTNTGTGTQAAVKPVMNAAASGQSAVKPVTNTATGGQAFKPATNAGTSGQQGLKPVNQPPKKLAKKPNGHNGQGKDSNKDKDQKPQP